MLSSKGTPGGGEELIFVRPKGYFTSSESEEEK
jgi:hypothetical protein